MSEVKRAELYTSPGGRFIRSDSLPRILAHWRSLRKIEKEKHFIKYDGCAKGTKWKGCRLNSLDLCESGLGDRFSKRTTPPS